MQRSRRMGSVILALHHWRHTGSIPWKGQAACAVSVSRFRPSETAAAPTRPPPSQRSKRRRVGGPSATVYHRFWHSPGDTPRWNFWGYRNAAVDAALEAALDAPLDGSGDGRFREAIARFEAAVRDDPPGVFLAWNQTVQAVSRRFALPPDSDGREGDPASLTIR